MFLEVFDHDFLGGDDYMGSCSISVKNMIKWIKKEMKEEKREEEEKIRLEEEKKERRENGEESEEEKEEKEEEKEESNVVEEDVGCGLFFCCRKVCFSDMKFGPKRRMAEIMFLTIKKDPTKDSKKPQPVQGSLSLRIIPSQKGHVVKGIKYFCSFKLIFFEIVFRVRSSCDGNEVRRKSHCHCGSLFHFIISVSFSHIQISAIKFIFSLIGFM